MEELKSVHTCAVEDPSLLGTNFLFIDICNVVGQERLGNSPLIDDSSSPC
jgi:hypothetical protein